MYVHLRLHYRTNSDESELQKGDIIEFNCKELAKYDKNSFFNLREVINQRTKRDKKFKLPSYKEVNYFAATKYNYPL